MKYKNEKLAEITALLRKIDRVNDLDSSYCEEEEAYLSQNVFALTNKEPKLWSDKSGNRKQCYANLFCKLLLAYLLKEIQEGTLLTKEFVNEIRDRKITPFIEFCYDDCGYETTKVLEVIMQAVICSSGYYQRDYEPIDISCVLEAEYNDGEREEELIKSIINTIPQLRDQLIKERELENFWSVCNYPVLECDSDLEIEIIESGILYEIQKAEKIKETEEGSKIIELSDRIFFNILQPDYLYDSLYWKVVDEEHEKVCYYLITCADLFGDECYWPMSAMQRLNRYSYENIFMLLDLQDKIGEYSTKYLS